MSRALVVGVLGGMGLALSGALAVAQDAPGEADAGPPPEIEVPLEVRVGMTIVAPGEPLPGAWAAIVSPGEGPAEAEAKAVTTDARGRTLLTVAPEGGVLLVWAEGRAPYAQWITGAPASPIVLDEPVSLSVAVGDPASQPVEGADVAVSVRLPVVGALPGSPVLHEYVVRRTTSEHGGVEIDGLPDVSLRVRADAAGFVGHELFPVRATSVALQLRRGAHVQGRAWLIPGGAPAEGVRLQVGGRVGTVAADGTWSVDAVPPGAAQVEVIDDDLLTRETRSLMLSDGERRAGIDLELLRTAVLSGRLVDREDRPVAAASLALLWPSLDAPWSGTRRDFPDAVTADGDGRFRLTGLPPADGVALEIRAAGRAPRIVEGLSLVPGEQLGPLVVVLGRGALITGRVVDAAGSAVEGAEVAARALGDAAERTPADTAVTGPGGVFLLDGLPAVPVRLRVTPPADSPWRAAEFGPFSPGSETAARPPPLVLPAGHALRGFVAGAPSDARGLAETSSGEVFDFALDAGVFEVDGLPPGDVFLEIVDADGYGGARASTRVPAGWPLELTWRAAAPVRLRLEGRGGRRVQRADLIAEPLPGAGNAVDAEPLPSTLNFSGGDVDGRFDLSLAPGQWRITARSGDLVGTVDVDVDALVGAEATVAMGHGEAVTGDVASYDGGRPVEGALVTVTAFGDADAPAASTLTNSRGHFRIAGVLPGIVRVRIEAQGHAHHVSRPMAVQRAASLDLGRVELAAGTVLAGFVHDAAGVPARGARVTYEHEEGDRHTTQTDLHGRFRIEHVSAGTGVVEVEGRLLPVHVPLGAPEVSVRVDLGEGTVLRGRVTTDGRPEPFARVVAWSLRGDALEAMTHTDGRGHFELPPLPSGEIGIEVLAADTDQPWETDTILPRAADHWVELALPAGGVAGTVIDAEGSGVAGARLWLWELDGEDRLARVVARSVAASGGTFRMERVPSGRFVLEARRVGHGEGLSQPFEVRAGSLSFGAQVRLPDEARVVGEVVDGRGVPVAAAWISATPYDDAVVRVRIRSRARADGRVVLRTLAPGSYEMAVGGPGRGRVELGVVRVTPGTTDLGRLTLEDGGALRITALYPGYVPAAGQPVIVEDLIGRDPQPWSDERDPGASRIAEPLRETRADGTLLIPDLAPGLYVVTPAGIPEATSFTVRVESGEVATVSLWVPWPELE